MGYGCRGSVRKKLNERQGDKDKHEMNKSLIRVWRLRDQSRQFDRKSSNKVGSTEAAVPRRLTSQRDFGPSH